MTLPGTNRPLAVAHRGFSARFPENTVRSLDEAVKGGSDLVEADARLAADGTLWCVHDPDLRRLVGQPLRIDHSASAVLAQIRLPGGDGLMTLSDALTAAAGRTPLLIDVKTADPATAMAVLRAVRTFSHIDAVWFGLRAADQVAAIRADAPSAQCLGFVPFCAAADAFLAAGTGAIRVWEADLETAPAKRLFGRVPVWVTTGGEGTGSAPGDVSEPRLEKIAARRPAAILLNDPTLLTRAEAAS
jgi:glycerophosphoryl diester phosphodiesterase